MAAEAKVPSVREQIPTAEFIEDLTAYMSKEGTAEAVIEKLQRMYSALKFIEQKLVQRKAKLKAKIPEIEATYGALKQMRSQAELGEPLIAHYELAQSVFAKAKVNVHEEDKVTPPPHRTLAFHTAHHAHHGTFMCARAARCTRRLHARAHTHLHRRHGRWWPRAHPDSGRSLASVPGVPVAGGQRDARVPAGRGHPAARGQPQEREGRARHPGRRHGPPPRPDHSDRGQHGAGVQLGRQGAPRPRPHALALPSRTTHTGRG